MQLIHSNIFLYIISIVFFGSNQKKIVHFLFKSKTIQLKTRSKDQVLLVFSNLLIFWHKFLKHFELN